MTAATLRLTPQHIAAIRLFATGHDRAATARAMHISTTTLDGYMAVARARMGAHTTTHLIALAIAAGHIPATVTDGTQRPA